jgi:hypothetical protein
MDEILAEVDADPASLGLILHGSRALDRVRPDSDYDLIRIVVDEEYERRTADGTLHVKDGRADYAFSTLARLRRHAENRGWWTAACVTARVVLDKTGEIAPLLDAIVARANEAALAGVPEAYDEALFGLEARWLPYLDALEPALPAIERAQGWDDGFLQSAAIRLLDGDAAFEQELEARVEALMDARGFPHEWGDDLEPLKALRFG